MSLLIDIIVFCFGAVIGSFLNVCSYRIPREKSIVTPGSSCPGCLTPIRFYDNIPLLSYIVLRGRCRHCGERISPRYPAVEAVTAILFLLLYRRFDVTLELAVMMLFVAILIVISAIDLEFQLIPDILSLGGAGAGLLLSLVRLRFDFLDSLIGIAVGGGILFVIAFGYQAIAKREGMGGGDIKLIAMIGAFCGYKGVLFSIVGGSLLGTIVGIPLMLIKGQDSKYAIPFGPFLSAAAVIYLFRGQNIIFLLTDILMHR